MRKLSDRTLFIALTVLLVADIAADLLVYFTR
jgi:hypothetical protein